MEKKRRSVLGDAELRAHWRPGMTEYCAEEGAVVTPAAQDFLREHGMTLRCSAPAPAYRSMTVTPVPLRNGKAVFQNAATGEMTEQKGEGMTHLRGNLLVPKTHPRIEFRGRLDSLMAKIICVQVTASEAGKDALCRDLGELLDYTRVILGGEVREEALPEMHLLGLDSRGIRRASHHVKETLGIDHPIPDYRMGKLCAMLNELRTEVREAELAAARAFLAEDGSGTRMDIIEGMNRLSSCVYILFCREAALVRGRKEER